MHRADDIREHYRRALVEVRTHLGSGWTAVEFRDAPVTWTLFSSTRQRPRDQGWKIHAASSIRDAPRLFANVVPALLASGCTFKLPASIDDAITINSGRAGRTLIGKIVTVYPGSDGEAGDLAVKLDRLWQSARAPEILTDLRLRPTSAIYVRFGAFTSEAGVQDAHGLYYCAVRSPGGALVPDERRLDGMQPPWARSPIKSAQPVQPAPQHELKLCSRRFLLLGTLQSAPKGDTSIATDEDFASTYVVKTARRGIGEDAAGTDCRARLQNEIWFLKFLAARGFKSPKLIACVDSAIAVEDIDGIPLHEFFGAGIGRVLARMAAAVAELHRLGVVHRDLKLSNATLAGEDVYLLDFELAAFAGADDTPSGGTPGHIAPERNDAPAAFATDIFALGASLAHAALGVNPATLAAGAGRLRALLVSMGHRSMARIVAAAMHRDPQRRPTASELARRLAELPDEGPAPGENRRKPKRSHKLQPRRWRKIMEAGIWAANVVKDRSAQSAAILPAPGPSPHGISSGLAGDILGLAAIGFATKRADFDDAIIGAAEVLAGDVKESPARGFFTGQAGIAFVLALAGRKYARNDLLSAGQRLFVSAAKDVVEVDLFSGAAGIVWSGCLLASVLRSEWPLCAAEFVARRLRETMNEKDGVPAWVSAGSPVVDDVITNTHLGAAHGSSGIAMSLGLWGRATGCARSLDLARETFLRLFQSGRTSDRRALRYKLGLESGTSGGTWCHGSAGYLWCMLQAFGDDHSLRAPIDWALHALVETPLLANPGYCHGMAGQLDLWSLLAGHPRHLPMAERGAVLAAQLLEQLGFRAKHLWVWPADEPDQIHPGLWTGALGPACALALFQGGRRDTLFSRQTLAGICAPQS
jgi:Lanthionine synthetase C-like protein/Protein kinase domain